MPQRAPSKPHSNDQAGYHSGDSASLQAVNAQVSAAHRATHPAPDAPPGQLPYSGPTGQTLYHANEAASLQATDKQVAAAHRAHYAGGLGADPVSAPSHAQAAREGPGKAPLAAPYSRDGGPYAVHRGALGGLEGVHGNATRGPMGGEGDAEERSRRSGSEGQVLK